MRTSGVLVEFIRTIPSATFGGAIEGYLMNTRQAKHVKGQGREKGGKGVRGTGSR